MRPIAAMVLAVTMILTAGQTAGAQDRTTRARAAREVTQLNASAEKFFRKFAEDEAFYSAFSSAESKKDWATATRLASEAAGLPVSSVSVGASLPPGTDTDVNATPDAGPLVFRGPWIGADAAATSTRTAETTYICFNLIIIKGCYIKTAQ